MKRNKQNHTISALLARYYLVFTLVLVALFYGLSWIWDLYTGSLLETPNPQGLLAAPAFQQGRYGEVDPKRYLGSSGAFAVADREGRLLYASSRSFPPVEGREELLCIPEYNNAGAVSSISFQTADGQPRLIVTRDHSDESGTVQTDVMVLDGSRQVLEGEILPGKTRYTQRELGYLTGSWSQDLWLSRRETETATGEPITLLLLLPHYSETYYLDAVEKAGRLWLLAIPLYLAAALLLVALLNRHFRRPLARLNQAILAFAAGKPASARDCGGPKEIQDLGRSFDAMAQKLAESEAETRRLEDQRIKMLTDISHDLKTPVTVIAGYTGAIRDGKVPPKELPQYLEAIGRKADALAQLVDRFHEYSKTQHPDFRLDLAPMDLCEFLREYLADRFDEIHLAGFSLEVEIPEGMTLPCQGDAFQLRRALDNLLSNALKHNRLGTLIRVSLAKEGDGAVLRIGDNGSGIPPALREDLFTPFAVGDRSRSKGGSGLGLAISQRILAAHGWTIRLAPPSQELPGTVFEILLPL